MSFQIYKLTNHYLKEPVTTTVGVRNESYPVPLFLFVAHTRDLFPPCMSMGDDPDRKCPFPPGAQTKDDDQVLDYEALTYGRSLVDARVQVSKDFNFRRARKKFDGYLNNATINGTKRSYYDLLRPYMTDITPWIESGGNPVRAFKVVQRSLWNIASYFMIEPAHGRYVDELNHDFQIETQFNWHNLSVLSPMRKPGHWVTFVLTSYGLLTDAIRFEPGRILKIRFDLQSHKQTPLRRKGCRLNTVRFKMYDEQRCNETCFLKAQQKWMSRTCYIHRNYEWGFYEMYDKIRPCSFGFYYPAGDNTMMNIGGERSDPLPGTDRKKMEEEHKRCLVDECGEACEELEVKLDSSSREFGTELGNKSLLYATWPAVNAVTVYEVGLQYTWDGFVGQLGGLVGLWMGASMMSFFEALYLCCCCCYDVRSERIDAPRRSNSNSTGIYKSARDEETRYGSDYNRNGNYYTSNKDELTKLRASTWTQDETERH